MTEPKTTPIFPLRRRIKRAPDPLHVKRLLEEMAEEYPKHSGRHKLLIDAANLVMGRSNV